jgi:hypothetical protein
MLMIASEPSGNQRSAGYESFRKNCTDAAGFASRFEQRLPYFAHCQRSRIENDATANIASAEKPAQGIA